MKDYPLVPSVLNQELLKLDYIEGKVTEKLLAILPVILKEPKRRPFRIVWGRMRFNLEMLKDPYFPNHLDGYLDRTAAALAIQAREYPVAIEDDERYSNNGVVGVQRIFHPEELVYEYKVWIYLNLPDGEGHPPDEHAEV